MPYSSVSLPLLYTFSGSPSRIHILAMVNVQAGKWASGYHLRPSEGPFLGDKPLNSQSALYSDNQCCSQLTIVRHSGWFQSLKSASQPIISSSHCQRILRGYSCTCQQDVEEELLMRINIEFHNCFCCANLKLAGILPLHSTTHVRSQLEADL